MIQQESRLELQIIAEPKNCFVSVCFRRNKRRYARIGDKIVCSVKSSDPRANVKKGDVVTAVVVRTAKRRRKMVLISDLMTMLRYFSKEEPRGTRIFGPVARDFVRKDT